ncbi:hypothetical protein [Pseudomonas sp. G5(2012)]|uniref:hypothetical protein n=1 Tax=Pseudomonas sp. G5(2012) TaxID=1268068 RepID=UPI0005B45EE8|nr:hypothetical protein [Pseudomonas sp. G5(2012)]
MTKILSLVLLSVSVSISVQAFGEDVKCKCNEVPFKPDPPCVKACVVSIMRNSDSDTFVETVGLTEFQEYSFTLFRNRPVADNVDVDNALRRKRSLNQVEMKLYSLPKERLEKIIQTVPSPNRTVLIPQDKVEFYKFDAAPKK